ncbi:phosphoenolpyruvate--protein phosphotransferase [Allocoleopsis franciscana]|uniref:Phosphocarrier protein HPr n=1 Tax=Allocoleopsis franciscana PCC 7113 TaxID=1173027 RepID=K9WGR0_9CYAN|nr:phosphoenolpyruvate--protein phosphotransferase [Allocoleopsis franciscana]AFZ19393.1 phosphotransferase system HPr (HPr) family protein [Allocoleopsis franciscana PCC 7113]
MVGIVIVSHSKKLADGVQELAQQMVQGAIRSAVAAGIDDPENPFGTDAMQIYQAIESVYTDEGVIVLMDLGSAILSAEMALEFLPEHQRDRVRLCEAPLVEGTLAAAVQAANGANIEQVLVEARGALTAKTAQLLGVRSEESPELNVGSCNLSSQVQPSTLTGQATQEIHLTVQNQMGLHARPAAKFVAIACRFQSQITVQNVTASSQFVNGKSINQVITLGVHQGDEIAIAATGSDATAAIAALQRLVLSNFGEATSGALAATPVPETLTTANSQLWGIPASPGIAIGPIVLYQPVVAEVTEHLGDNPHESWEQLQDAIATACQELQTLRHQVAEQVGEEEAAIFDAHLLCLSDPAIVEAARQRIFDYTLDAVSAWKVVVARTVRSYEALKDPYLKARAADVRDVGLRVLRLLTGVTSTPLDFTQPAILVATDLTPSETAHLNPHKVLGICTIAGGATSHSGILARSLGIPAVVGVDVELLSLEDGTLIALDGETGQVWVQPEDAELRDLQTKRDRQRYIQQEQRTAAQQPAVTQDGRLIQIVANIGGIADARVALANGAEGVGLLRSEFLYFDRESSPTEEEQVEQYEAIASMLSPRPLIIRTLDIGGDKPLSYLNLASEPNPFLGWRGIRFLLDSPDVLKTQLRAILRATHHYPIKVMFPMIACLREIRAAKEILATAQAELYRAGIPFNESMEVGMMVEVPAAVAMAEKLAAEVDFFSIGTNDLSQYVMASDRTNPKVATLADAFEPAVLRMIQQTIQAARQAGIGVGVCGELASLPLATPILVGLGVDELSMNPPSIGAIKAAVGRLSIEEAQAIARDVLQLDSSEAVREYVAQKAGRLII